MMRRYELSDDQWIRIEHLLPGKPGDPGGQGEDNPLFVNAIIWIARTGTGWRDLPERFGNWNSVFLQVRPAHPASYEHLFHKSRVDARFLPLRDPPGRTSARN